MNEEIAARIRLYPEEELPCAVAHYIAAQSGARPLDVGHTADEMGVRINMCQLGLFGYARKGKPDYRIFRAWEDVPGDLAAAIAEVAVDGRISCVALWRIGARFDLSRHEMGNAVEGVGLKVKPCQLGFF